MNKSNISRKLIITLAFIIVASIAVAVMIFAVKSKADTQEAVAKTVALSKLPLPRK